jgi:hypothetical protein
MELPNPTTTSDRINSSETSNSKRNDLGLAGGRKLATDGLASDVAVERSEISDLFGDDIALPSSRFDQF